MAAVKYQNQSEYSFVQWMSQHPESAHPLDNERFLIFVKTVARYRNMRWLSPGYFKERVLALKPHFDQELLDHLNELMYELVEFYKVTPVPTHGLNRDKATFMQYGSVNGNNYAVEISQREYMGKGATPETMKRAEWYGPAL